MSPRARALPLCLLAIPFAASAQPAAQPQPLPLPPAIVTPQDTPYPGTIELTVDATDLSHHVFRIHEDVPVQQAGDFVLLFPKWIPGNHSPTGPIPTLGGLIIKSGTQRLAWTRDTVQEYAFHIDVPQGATSLSVDFDYLSPLDDEKEGRVVMTPNMLDVQWNPEVLYPAGHFARQITLHPHLTLPDGWQYGTALSTESATGGHVTFKPTTLNVLLDSPLYAGRYFSRIDLDPHGVAPVHLDIVADKPEDLVIKPEDLAAHRSLVQQAYRNYGSHHYDHYDFLLSLSDEMGGEGLEHHRSSENGDRTRRTSPISRNPPPTAICCRTNIPIAGTASSAARPICGRPISTSCRSGTACFGSMRARRSIGARCWRRARASSSSTRCMI